MPDKDCTILLIYITVFGERVDCYLPFPYDNQR